MHSHTHSQNMHTHKYTHSKHTRNHKICTHIHKICTHTHTPSHTHIQKTWTHTHHHKEARTDTQKYTWSHTQKHTTRRDSLAHVSTHTHTLTDSLTLTDYLTPIYGYRTDVQCECLEKEWASVTKDPQQKQRRAGGVRAGQNVNTHKQTAVKTPMWFSLIECRVNNTHTHKHAYR